MCQPQNSGEKWVVGHGYWMLTNPQAFKNEQCYLLSHRKLRGPGGSPTQDFGEIMHKTMIFKQNGGILRGFLNLVCTE
jgi:hypothetical protein